MVEAVRIITMTMIMTAVMTAEIPVTEEASEVAEQDVISELTKILNFVIMTKINSVRE